MKTKAPAKANKASNVFAALTIILCLIIGYCLWNYVMGNPANFQGGDRSKLPLDGNILGMIFKGGYIVPILMGMLLMTIVFSIERFFVLNRAEGRGSLDKFVSAVKGKIADGDMAGAKAMCDKQRGSVANVINAALVKYDEVKAEGFDSEKAAEMIGKEVEDATSLEMPSLEKNMTIISTMVSIGTLFGLLGTVTGMIRAFAGLSAAGAPDQAQLATGISEALVNTATGIGTSIIATIAYNFFTSKIDTLTYFIDESGSAITQAYRKLRATAKK